MGLDVDVKRRLKGFSLDVSFRFEKGVLGILGASGSGKSMTLRSIAGIDRPDGGMVELGGRMLYHAQRGICLKPQARRVGYLFQSCALFPNMTVEQNIGCALPGRERKARVAELTRKFRLSGLERRYPSQLSGGQAQRVALARCLAAGPEALLLDEPFSALDALLRERMQLELIDMLRDYGGLVVLVTHDQREAYRLCTHLAVVDEGRLIAFDERARLFEKPTLARVARLTGCRNIARAVRVGARRVRVPDWGVELDTAEEVPGDVDAVGIREGSFLPADEKTGGFPVRYASHLEEMDALSARVILPGGDERNPLWVRLPKNVGLPPALRVRPEDVLLLKGMA